MLVWLQGREAMAESMAEESCSGDHSQEADRHNERMREEDALSKVPSPGT